MPLILKAFLADESGATAIHCRRHLDRNNRHRLRHRAKTELDILVGFHATEIASFGRHPRGDRPTSRILRTPPL